MKVEVVENYRELSDAAADMVAAAVKLNHELVLGLATGSTPEGMYARLVNKYREKQVDFSSVVTFNLDEYIGLAPEHPQSYSYYMHRHLFDHVNIKPSNTHIPCSYRENADEICREYEKKIKRAGGIDLQVLGIGVNGHIGFNEPQESLSVYTYLVDLSEETIEANSRFFNSLQEVPRQAITMGVGTIMHAKKIVLLAGGKSKARAVRQSFRGNISTARPASLLQLHRDFILLADKEAAALL